MLLHGNLNVNIKPILFSLTLVFSCHAVSQTAPQYYEDALRAFNDNDYGTSYIHLKNALSEDTDHLPSKLLMGKVLLIDGFVNDAITEFEEVLAAGADQSLVLVPLAHAYLQASKFEKVKALATLPDQPRQLSSELAVLAAHAFERQGQISKARAVLEKQLNNDPANLGVRLALSNLYIDTQQFAQAQDLISALVQEHGDTAPVLQVRGKLLSEQGRKAQAITTFELALEKSPDDPAILRSLAASYAEAGQFVEAREVLTSLQRQSPNDVMNMLLQARILAMTNEQEEADEVLRELTELFSLLEDTGGYQRTRLSVIAGVVAFINKNYELASSELSRYVAATEPTPQIITLLTQSLLQQSLNREALKLLERYQHQVKQNIELTYLACELFIASNRSFRCAEILAEVPVTEQNNEYIALLQVKLLAQTDRPAALDLAIDTLTPSALPQAQETLALLQGDLGNFDAALTTISALLERYPNSLSFQNVKVDLLIRTNQIDEAASMSEKLLQREDVSSIAYMNAARIAVAQSDLSTAKTYILESLKQDGTSVPALVLGAQIYSLRNEETEGIALLLDAKALAPKSKDVKELLISLYLKTSQPELALAETDKLLALDRLSIAYRVKKAEILLLLESYDEAAAQLKIALPLVKEDMHDLLLVSNLQIQSGDFGGAETTLLHAIDVADGSPLASYSYVRFLLDRGRLNDAANKIAQLDNQHGFSPSMQLLKGDLAQQQGAPERASELFLAAIEADPKYTLAYVRLYELSRQGINNDNIFQAFERAIANAPNDTFIKHLYADALFNQQRWDTALPLYEALLSVENLPKKHSVFNNAALILNESKPKKALSYARKAVETLPNDAMVNDTYGWLLAQSNALNKGLEYLRTAYVLNSQSPEIQYHLAHTLHALGRTSEARKILIEHNTASKNFEGQASALQLYEAVTSDG